MPTILSKTESPWLLKTHLSFSKFLEQAKLFLTQEEQIGIFLLNGNNMSTWEDLFKECASVLRFPDYFGYNIHALDECMRDMYEWLEPEPNSYILYVDNSEGLLEYDNQEKGIEIFLKRLVWYAEEWAEERFFEEGNVNNKKSYPFHVIFHSTKENVPFMQELPELILK